MSVVLTDEEFIRIYQAAYLSIHPGQDLATALLAGYSAIAVLDAVPEIDQLRQKALLGLPDLGPLMKSERRVEPPGSEGQPEQGDR